MMNLPAFPPTLTLPLQWGGSQLECDDLTLIPSPLRGEGQGGGGDA